MAPSHGAVAAAVFFFVLLSGAPRRARSQQPYGSAIADCGNTHNDSGLLGYFCGGANAGAPSCASYLTFHVRPPYSDLASVAALLGADAAAVAEANAAASSPASAFPPGTKVLVPVNCSCTGTGRGRRHYQRNATYVARDGDTLLIIANNTLQGLSTCQAIQEQGLGGAKPESLLAGQRVTVPLRCACPSAAQAAAGFRFLVSYLVDEFDEVRAVAARFGVDAASVMAANELTSESDTIYPFTTLLIPVRSQPDISQLQSPPPRPPPPPVVPAPAKKSRNHAGVYIGIAVGVAAFAVVASVLALLALKARRRRAGAAVIVAASGGVAKKGSGKASPGVTAGEVSVSISDAFSSLSDIKSSLKVYTYAELKAATDDFSPDRSAGGGSVYRAVFNGDAAAVEVVDRDVSSEVEIMRSINHFNLVRLIGLGHHRGRWYLVSEYAEHGTLRDRLLLAGGRTGGAATPLSWAQRMHIALDVAEGLRYLHGYAQPPYVHMDLSSGNVLLAGGDDDLRLRAKIQNFGGARAIRGGGGGGDGLASSGQFTMTSRIAGTRGYMAPEYLEHGVVSPKADVYSLGVVLLELVTGKDVERLEEDGEGDPLAGLNALLTGDDDGDGEVLRQLEEFVDPAMPPGSCPRDAVVMMVRLIERCVRRDAAARPGMGEVVQYLLRLSGISGDRWQSSSEHDRSSGGESSQALAR